MMMGEPISLASPNALNAPLTPTPLSVEIAALLMPAALSKVAKVPVGRQGTPAEVAAVARMLVSDGGAYINAQMLQVNGGAQT